MDEFNSTISSLLSPDYGFINLISSKKFCSSLIEQLQTQLENESLKLNETNNSHLLNLSALINLFEIDAVDQLPLHLTKNKGQIISDAAEFEETKNPANLKNWFKETLNFLHKQGKLISTILINTLNSKRNKFVRFLSRKAVISGLKSGFFEIKQILQCLDVDILASNIHQIWAIELLIDLVEHAQQKKSETELILSWFECHCVVQKIFTMVETAEVLEHLILLQKLVKLAAVELSSNKKDTNIIYLKNIFCEVLFPHVNHMLRASEINKQNSFHFLKVVDNILVTEWLYSDQSVPNGVLDILKVFNLHFTELFNSLQHCDLLSDTNFIGGKKKQNNPSNNDCHVSSSLLKKITLVFLKSSALSSQATQNVWKSLLPFLQVFDWAIGNAKTGNSVQKWFIAHFADQDNHWITSILSLLVIYKQLKKRSSAFQGHTEQSLRGGISSPQDFFFKFCPHKTFLYFVEFIEYDHLVLSDFLISPETSFLPYILSYLRFVLEDWRYFTKIMSSFSQKDSFKQSGLMPEEKSFYFVQAECKILNDNSANENSGTSILKHPNPNVQQNVQIVSYSDSEDSTPSPSPIKRCCLENEVRAEQDVDICSTIEETIKPVAGNSQSFNFAIEATGLEEKLDQVMGMFIRLRMHIDRLERKRLFPYRAEPLIKLLMACEENYEM